MRDATRMFVALNRTTADLFRPESEIVLDSGKRYRVQCGDTLRQVAAALGISPEAL